MANTQAIKRRITSVQNTRQITKAMELVAASKMRRAQQATLRSRAYRNTAREILTKIGTQIRVSEHALFARRTVRTRLYVVITSDRGLAGAYNSSVLKHFVSQITSDMEQKITCQSLMIGRQGAKLTSRLEGLEVLGVYTDFPDQPTAQDLQPIMSQIMKGFIDKSTDEVQVIYTDYQSSIQQVVQQQQLLPAQFEEVHMSEDDASEAVFEPSPQIVLETITPRLIEVQLLQACLESSASEHSMRMMAMKSASDNANDLIDDLTLVYNSARQASITQELAEIVGGAEAITA